MALIDAVMNRLRSSTSGRMPAIFTPRVTITGSPEEWWSQITEDISKSSPAELFRKQPHLRTVVSFIARNVAQLGLHSFIRVDEQDRQRDRDSLAAKLLQQVDGQMTTYELIYALVGDIMLYDRAYWFVGQTKDTELGWMIRRLPPSWVSVSEATPFEVKTYRVSAGQQHVDVPADQILAFPGYNPVSVISGSPAVEALRATLQEQIEASVYRSQVWKRGGRVSAVIERPQGSKWSDDARRVFREDWYAKFTGTGKGAGGTPILEDGMQLKRIDFSAREQEFVDAAKLSLITVAAAYHVNPTMIGLNDGANYSNVREFRKMLYGDTLGPTLAQIEARINSKLLPMLGMDPAVSYVEFNIAEKLQGNFEEQAAAYSSATGRPYMTPNEVRARQNLPALPGDADELATPLNVLIGGQASPRDSAPKAAALDPIRRLEIKARAAQTYEERVEQIVGKHFTRQERVVRAALGSKASPDWWDAERWNTELGTDLLKLALMIATAMGVSAAEVLGFDGTDYDEDRTIAWLTTVTTSQAAAINETTKDRIAAALDKDPGDDPDESPLDKTFAAQAARAATIAATAVTLYSAFGATEAGRQLAPEEATKRWSTGANPRPAHQRMDGETVGVNEKFSNGARWPGDGLALDADDLAGCNCTVVISR